MKKLLFAIAVLLINFHFATAQPQMKSSCGEVFDWGKVNLTSDPLKTIIKLYNTGNKSLEIYNVKPSCGCTTAPIDKNLIPPGDSARLDVTFQPGFLPTKVEKTISILTNDPYNTHFTITLKAELTSPIIVHPQRFLYFGKMKPGVEAVCKLVMSNKSGAEITIDSICYFPSSLKINMKNRMLIEKDSDFVLEAAFTPKEVGPYNFKLTFRTDNPDLPEMIIEGRGDAMKEE